MYYSQVHENQTQIQYFNWSIGSTRFILIVELSRQVEDRRFKRPKYEFQFRQRTASTSRKLKIQASQYHQRPSIVASVEKKVLYLSSEHAIVASSHRAVSEIRYSHQLDVSSKSCASKIHTTPWSTTCSPLPLQPSNILEQNSTSILTRINVG